MRAYAKKVLKHHVMTRMRSGVVLLYHRIADLETDPQLLAVSPRNFAEHLEVLRQSYEPVRLRELHRHLRGPSSRRPPVTLTFDDGYADNLHHGLPLLQAAGVPATAFVVTGQLGLTEEFWWDELERILLGVSDLPEELRLIVGSRQFSWRLPRTVDDSDPHWHVLSGGLSSPRQAAYRELSGLLGPLDNPARTQVLDSLRDWAKDAGSGRARNRALAEEEVAALANDGLVEVGAHTITHPLLSAQPVAIQRDEIERSKRRLEEILSAEVRCFSYPYGRREDYTSATVRLVKDAGYECACSNFPRRVFRGTDRYRIPRFVVRDWTGDEFARRLEAFFHA